MNIPAHLSIDISADEQRQLEGIRREFLSEMHALDPRQQLARASVIAGGIKQRDPLTRALAQQIVDVDKLNREAAAAQDEVDYINSSRRRIGLDPSPNELARREVLLRQIEEARARQIGILENDFGGAKRKTVVQLRERAAQRAYEARLSDSIARQSAEAEQAAIDAKAAAVVRAKRLGAGAKPNRAGNAQ